MFGTQQAVFSVTRNRFRNRKQLARKGVENSSEVVVFYRAPRVPRPISWRPSGPRHFHSKLAPQNLVFAHYRTKNGANPAGFAPEKGSIRSNFSRIKCPLQFSFGCSERFLMIRLHKIWRYNTCLPAHQKEVSTTYFAAQALNFGLNSAASSAKDSPFEDKKKAGSEVRNRPLLFKRGGIYTKQPSSSGVRSSRTCLICCSCERGQISRASGVSTTI